MGVSVLFGHGDGTFAVRGQYAAGSVPRGIAAGDVNGDDRADIVAANAASGDISVLLNRGDGTLAPAVNYAAGEQPVSVAIADLDGDRDADLAVAAWGFDVAVLLGNGDGSFAPSTGYPVYLPRFVQAADLDDDGDADLAVVGGDCGSGLFAAGGTHGIGGSVQDVAVADLDGDGRNDVVVTDVGISLFLNDRCSIGDLDHDGAVGGLDLEILLATWGSCPGPPSLCLGDLDGDSAVGIVDFLALLSHLG